MPIDDGAMLDTLMDHAAEAVTVNPEDEAELREGFEQFDTDHDGLMQFEEFLAFISELDADMSLEESRIGFEDIDTDRNGVINFDEFVQWWTAP
jgi:calmodulin